MSLTMEKRLERLEKLLAELVSDNRSVPVVVEGRRDERALRGLGLSGEIYQLNVGRPIVDRVEEVVHRHGSVIILTDWDRKGEQLHRRVGELVRAGDGKVHGTFWRSLRPLVHKDIQAVEDLDMLMAQLREKSRA